MSAAMTRKPTGSRFATLAIHAGARPDPIKEARANPAYQTTSDAVDDAASFFDLRVIDTISMPITDPTSAVLEERVAALEGGTAALAVASGPAARVVTFQALLRPGDEFIAAQRLCASTVNQFDHAFKSFGWQVKWVDPDKPESFVDALSDKTKAIFIESMADAGAVMDIEAIARVARRARIPLVVDNSLATAYLIRPFEHSGDIVLYSTTAFLGGHGNAVGGLIVDGGTFDWLQDDRYPLLSKPSPSHGGTVIGETFGNFAFAVACRALGLRNLGAPLSSYNASLILAGIETLPLRMQRHSENALVVAHYLERHEAVTWVRHAGLATDPGHALAQRYCPRGIGAVFTFGLAGGSDAAIALVDRLKLFSRRADVGTTRSLVVHPASTTQHGIAGAQEAAAAFLEAVRVSIGLEDIDDIIADLNQALAG